MPITRAILLRTISEKGYAQQIYDLARYFRWRCYRTHDSRHSPAGYPDLSLLHGQRHVYAEIKTEKGKLTPEQRGWLVALYEAGHEVYVFRPSSWSLVVDVLSGAYQGRRLP